MDACLNSDKIESPAIQVDHTGGLGSDAGQAGRHEDKGVGVVLIHMLADGVSLGGQSIDVGRSRVVNKSIASHPMNISEAADVPDLGGHDHIQAEIMR